MTLERITLASGIELDVEDRGPRDAPAIVFLHGFPESHRTWRHQIPHLEDRFRCIAPDQRGYCGSSKPVKVEAYRPDRLIGDIFQLADALGIEKFTLVGHDWGGAIAWGGGLMGQALGRVERLAIMNAPHPAIFQRLLYTDPVQRAASQYMRAFRDPANDALVREQGLAALIVKAFGGPDLSTLPENERESLVAMATRAVDPAERAIQLAQWEDSDAAFGMLNWYRATPIVVPPADAPFEIPDGANLPELPRLTIPTLVIWALDDMALPPVNLEGLEDVIDDLTLVKVPDCGHFVPWEAPDKVNAALDEFLTRTAG